MPGNRNGHWTDPGGTQWFTHGAMSMSYSVYSLGLDLHGLQDVVERVQYNGLDLLHLHQ